MPSNKDIFFKAVFLEPPRICGKRLHPFSLAHEYFLKHLNNPIIVGGSITDDDLLTAIFVCSLTFKELREYFNQPSTFKVGLWFLRWRYRNLAIAHESFAVYLSEYYDVPDHFKPEPKEGEELPVKEERAGYGCPYQYHLMHILCREYSMSIDEAWNTSLTTARCYYDVWSESTGFDDSCVPVDVGQPLLEKPDA